MTVVTEAGGMWPWAKGPQQPPEASRGRALPLILWSKQARAGSCPRGTGL